MPDVYKIFLDKYKSYTPIQEVAMPMVREGRNCVIIAPTGAGKTEAAVLPLLDKLSNEEGKTGIRVLYVTPLRALNRDMISRLEQLCKAIGVTIAVRHGDTTQSERGKQARRAPQVLITTPETLQSMLPTKTMGAHLRNVAAVVIDEIHELYSSKRGAQLSIALERLERIANGFQRIGISATVGDRELIGKFLCNRRAFSIASTGSGRDFSIDVEFPQTYKRNLSQLADRFGLDNQALARLEAIADHIGKSKSTIVFANTRQIVEALGSRLVHLNGIEDFGGIGVHHSSLDRDERIRLENEFKSGNVKSIIATSSLELGIDVGDVNLVVQYGSPRQALRLIQRVGRSGHSLTKVPRGIVVAPNLVDALEAISICRNVGSWNVERFNVHRNALDVLANQICGIALDTGICAFDELLRIVNRSYLYDTLGAKELRGLLEFMAKQRMVGFDGNRVTSGAKTRMFYYSHLSVIPDTKRYVVKNIADNRIISSLDEGFVVSSLEEGSVFITKGLPWKVISIDENVVSIEPSTDLDAAVPDWSGEDIPVSKEVSMGVFDLVNNPSQIEKVGCVGKSLLDEIKKFIMEQKDGCGLPSNEAVLIEQGNDYQIIYTGLGTLANEALSRIMAHRLSTRLGRSVSIKASPYMIFVEVPESIDIIQLIKQLSSSNLKEVIEDIITETELFRYKFVVVAKRFGIIDRDSTVSKSTAKRLMKLMVDSPIYHETLRELVENYFDINTLTHFVDAISRGKIKAGAVKAEKLSPISKIILDSAYYTRELIMPLLPSDAILESFSKALFSKNIKLLCTYCGFTFQRSISSIKDESAIECPSCTSPMLVRCTDAHKELVEARRSGKKKHKTLQSDINEMMKEASLFQSYGGRAAVALSTYGVGPTNAARILMMLRRDEKLFLMDLIDAQKQFIKNKKYWTV
ncbi:MAG: DEAD/DEAH box helicase [Candidatus Marsarchaeota archaeon]|nr:DEAD/DEAH box helicase [Candidatus Marsarchaeota archaeon]